MDDTMKQRVDQLVEYIMKKCLWQFHSRVWDRERQNKEILMKTTQILCEEPVENETPYDRCYWVDAVYLADAYRKRYLWLSEMNNEEIKLLMQEVKSRMDYLTITGSKNEELTVPLY